MESHKDAQKLVELKQVMPILQIEGINPDDVLCEDSPDIRLSNFYGKHIGIEAIECHYLDIATDKKLQIARRNFRLDKICNKYAEKCKQEGVSVNVSLEFTHYTYQLLSRCKCDEKKIEDEIIDEIERHQKTDNIRSRIFDEQWQSLCDERVFNYKYVSSATFFKPLDGRAFVSRLDGGGVKCIEQEYVEYCIRDKETKLPIYKLKNPQIDEFWLCVFVDEMEFRKIDNFKFESLTTDFDRVYLTTRSKVNRIK